MAPNEINHGSGNVGDRPSPPETQEMEQYPDNISLSQSPETAQRAVELNDNDHPDTDVGNPPAVLANGASSPPGPHIEFMDSPPRPEARLTPPPPPPPATGFGPAPAWNRRTTAWHRDQDEDGPLVGLGLTLYPPGTPGTPGQAGEHVVMSPERRAADGRDEEEEEEEPAGDRKDVATGGGGQASSGRR